MAVHLALAARRRRTAIFLGVVVLLTLAAAAILWPRPEPAEASGAAMSLSVYADKAKTPGLYRIACKGSTVSHYSGVLANVQFVCAKRGAPGR